MIEIVDAVSNDPDLKENCIYTEKICIYNKLLRFVDEKKEEEIKNKIQLLENSRPPSSKISPLLDSPSSLTRGKLDDGAGVSFASRP